jgi:hypothetical protein
VHHKHFVITVIGDTILLGNVALSENVGDGVLVTSNEKPLIHITRISKNRTVARD